MLILKCTLLDGRPCCINARRIDAIVPNKVGTEVYVGGNESEFLVKEPAEEILSWIPDDTEEIAPTPREPNAW